VVYDVRKTAPPKSRKQQRSDHFKKFRVLRNDILAGRDAPMDTADPLLRAFAEQWRKLLPVGPYAEGSVPYDVQVRPAAYLPMMVAMADAIKGAGKRTFQVLPMRMSNTPAYVNMDTTALEELTSAPQRKKGDLLTYSRKMDIWKSFLDVETTATCTPSPSEHEGEIDDALTRMARTFRRGKQSRPRYVFRGAIATDGFGVSIMLVRTDLHDLKGDDGEWMKAAKQDKAGTKAPVPDVEKLENVLVTLDGRGYAVVDPGKRDLHYVLGDVELPDGKTKRRHLRYTQATRAAAMKKKRYDTIRTKLHEAADAQAMAGKTVKGWDVELSNFDSRATIPATFEKWIRAKMAAVEWTRRHWQNETFRRLKFNAKANARRSADTYLNKFKDTFGDASECVVIVGDWSQGTGHLKHSPPTMRRGLVAELRRRRYEVWLIKEFRTSKSCSKCHSGDCEPHEHEGKARHGLLRCKNVDCEQFHNRNANATRNMLRIVEAAKAGTGRPADMARAA
jgi:hypothetical protein